MHGHRLLLLPAIALLAACTPDVRVVDHAGRPIADAEIYSTSLSMGIGPSRTNRDGYGEVPGNIQGTRWITVSHPGFLTSSTDAPSAYPIVIVLDREQDFVDGLSAAIPPGTMRADALARLHDRRFQTRVQDHVINAWPVFPRSDLRPDFCCRIPLDLTDRTGTLATISALPPAKTATVPISVFDGPLPPLP